MKNKTILLFDMNNIIMRGMGSIPYLSYNGKFTSGLYGTISQMAKYTLVHEPDYIVICNDAPPYYRKELFPDYKKRTKERTEKDEEIYSNLKESREYCHSVMGFLKIPIVQCKGFEADDMIACLVKAYQDKNKIIIISNDSDLYQLLSNPNVIMDKGKSGLFSLRELKRDYGITADRWIEILSIAGSHNAVPPIKKGIGVKTALKIIKNKENYKDIFKKYKNDIILRSKLAMLPFEPIALLEDEIFSGERSHIPFEKFKTYLRRNYGIEMNLSFEKFFRRIL